MPDLLPQLLSINPFKDILIPATAALLALWLASRKFKQERIWQEKYAGYQRVLESIEAIRYWGDEISSDVHMLPSVGYFNDKNPSDFYAAAQREVVKQTSIGTILLSPGFVEELSNFRKELYDQTYDASEEHYDDEQEREFAYAHHASEVRKIADKYLPQLIELARQDLGA